MPLSFFGGIGGASAHGVLVKGSNYLEVLSKISHLVCDKTGTITKGNFKVTKINAANCSELELLTAAAKAEQNSNHPIAKSLMNELKSLSVEEYNNIINAGNDAQIKEIAGYGIEYVKDNEKILAGNHKLMDKENISYDRENAVGTIVYVAKNNKILGNVVIEDIIKDDAVSAIDKIKKMGINLVMLTGDKTEIAKDVAAKVGIDNVYSELLPQDKVEKVNWLLKNKDKDKAIAFVGDGINDAPVLAGADVGIAMGGLGSDAAIEAADIVIMDDKLTGIVKAIKIAKKTVRIVKENIVFALGVKILILILAAFGIANMWMAVFADVGVAFLAIINALRAMKIN